MKNLLLTLSASIKQLSSTTMIDQDKWGIIELVDSILTRPLKLKYFVVCGEDGTPMTKPKEFEPCDECDMRGYEPCACACESLAYEKEYKEALKLVVLKGWKVSNTYENEVFICNDAHIIGFYKFNKEFVVKFGLKKSSTFSHHIENFEDLAQATSENPIKLK